MLSAWTHLEQVHLLLSVVGIQRPLKKYSIVYDNVPLLKIEDDIPLHINVYVYWDCFETV